MLAESTGPVVSWAIDDIVAVDLLGSPVLRIRVDGEVQTRLDGFDGLRRKEWIVKVCSGEVG